VEPLLAAQSLAELSLVEQLVVGQL
jgi:hypothetical protein